MEIKRLIPGSISRKILNSIVNDQEIDLNEFSDLISQKEYSELKTKYQKIKDCVPVANKALLPKFYPFYKIIKEKYNFSVASDKKDEFNLHISVQRIDSLRPSLLNLLLSKDIIQLFPSLHNISSYATTLATAELNSLSKLIENIEGIPPKINEIDLLMDWIKKGKKGEPLIIFIPICPDYSAEKKQNSKYKYRYTVSSLGSGNGIVAEKILQIIPRVKRFVDELNININVTVKVGLSDFEGFSPITCDKLGITKNLFIERVQSSKAAFENACPIKIETLMISELLGGEAKWLEITNNFFNCLKMGHYGNSNANEKKIIEIIRRRKSLYERWFGKKDLFKDYKHTALYQAAEYATIGYLINENFKNCLILGADNSAMRSFYNYTNPIPMIYVKPFYD